MTQFVTTPIYYPNDVPHLGTAYPTLAADVRARWARLCGDEVFMLTGTDEHGKKIENAARKKGVEPQRFVNELAGQFRATSEELDIQFDRFIRTTDLDHVQVVQELLQRIYEHGDIYKGTYEGHYCVECENYYAEDELENGCCPTHGKPAEWLEEECFYFRLSEYQDWLLEYYEEHPDFVQPEARRNEVVRFVEGGLEDLCISRSTFDWGVPLPFADGHITYVWFDALINYLTGAGYQNDRGAFEERWPTATHIIGKDILRFHAVIWPAMLRSVGVAPPRQVFAHGFWTVNGRKFSKSLGNAIQPGYLTDTYGLDPLRYYIFRAFAFGTDGDFSEADLVERNNSELADGLGNLVRRATTMIERYREGVIPSSVKAGDPEHELARVAGKTVQQVSRAVEELAFKEALEAIWKLVRHLNGYLNEREPWTLAKANEADLLNTVLAHLAEGLRHVAVLISPFMPRSGEEIARRLGLTEVPQVETLQWDDHLAGSRVEVGPVLFEKLEVAERPAPPPVEHRCADEVRALGIPYCVAQIDHVTIRKQAAEVEARKRSVEERIKALGRSWTEDIPEARGYHRLYERIGKAPGEVASPIDLLSNYIFDSERGRLPQINAVVDLYNVYALEHCLSIGAHDREKIQGAIRLDVAEEPVSYRPLGSDGPVTIEPREYCWHDDEHVLCRLDVKQGEATKVNAHTRHLVLIVQGNPAISGATVREQTEALCEDIADLCGGDYEIIGEVTGVPQRAG